MASRANESGALLATSIATSPAAVDVTRDSVEQPPLYQRTTLNHLPAFFQANMPGCSAGHQDALLIVAGSMDNSRVSQ